MKKFNDIASPQELFDYLVNNFKYGIKDLNGKKWFGDEYSMEQLNQIFNSDWRTQTPKSLLKNGIGNCYDYTEIERYWFKKNNYKYKTFWVCAYQEAVPNSGVCHSYLVYYNKGYWFYFEVADYDNRGIYKFKTLKELKKFQENNLIKYSQKFTTNKKDYNLIINEYNAPKENMNILEFMNFCSKNN